MVMLRRFPGLALALLLPEVCHGGQPPQTKPDFSKEAAVIETFHTEYKFENDGTYTQDVAARVKVQSKAGVQQYGVLVFAYASAIAHMTIDYVRVRQPDGTVVVTPPSSIQNVTPQVTIAAPEYSDLREMHVAVKGLTPGSEIEYRFHSGINSPLIPGQFWLAYDFTKNAIILDEELEVNVPKDRAIKVKSASVQPVVTAQGGRRIYVWKTSNQKNVTLRRYLLGQLPAPDVLLSSFESWAQVGKWWASLEEPEMAPTAAIRAKAAVLTQSLTTQDRKLQAIYSYVGEQFRYISISFGIGRYKPHAADQVLGNGYGDCKDKHTLLASLLGAAGIKAFPVLINSARKIDPDVPSPGQFDHVITAVPDGPKLQWMDTTTELAPLGLLVFSLRGKRALVIPDSQPPFLAKTPAEAPLPNRAVFEADGTLSSNGTFQGRIKHIHDGDGAVVMRLLFNNIAQSYWQKAIQEMSEVLGFGGTVSNVQVSPPEDTGHPFTFSYDYSRHDYSNWSAQSPHQITPPLPLLGLPALPHAEGETPQPYVLGEPLNSDYRARMTLPRSMTVTLPQPLDVTAPFAEYHSTYSFKDGLLTAERRLIIKADEVPVAQLEEYRKFQKAESEDIQNQITLTAEAGASAGAARPRPEFQQDLREAYDKLASRDLQGALDATERALKLNPKSAQAWQYAGWLHSELGESDQAVTELRKAIALDPRNARAYGLLAGVLAKQGRPDDAIATLLGAVPMNPKNWQISSQLAALLWREGRRNEVIEVWRNYVRRNPSDSNGHASLAASLMYQKKYKEAETEYEAACKLNPSEWRCQQSLGDASVGAGDTSEAVTAYEKAVSLNPVPFVWNNVAYDMAQHDLKLPEAERFAKMAVQGVEGSTTQSSLDDLQDKNLMDVVSLSQDWDTLGWVYYHERHIQEARKYIEASWMLNQDAVVGDHLGQIEEKLGRKQAAIRDYALSLLAQQASGPAPRSANSERPEGAKQRLERLLGRGSIPDSILNKARDELSAMRTYRLSKAGLKPGTAEFFVLIGAGGKALGVKFISGDDSLRAADKAIAAIKFNQPFPDDAPVRILRRGVLSCSKLIPSCDFVLLLPEAVHSIH